MSEQANARPRVMSVPLEQVPASPRQAVPAQPAPQALMAGSQPVPVESAGMGGRLPEGGGNATMKQRSVFEGARGAGSPVREIRLMNNGPVLSQLQVMQAAQTPRLGPQAAAAQDRTRAYAQPELGQAAPAAAAPAREAEVEKVIQRQLPPEGLARKEAQQLADALTVAIDVAKTAVGAGEKCFGVDDASIADASRTRDYLANFAHNAGAADRTDPSKLTQATLDSIERILECQMAHEKAQGGNVLAIVVGVVVIGGIALLVAHNA